MNKKIFSIILISIIVCIFIFGEIGISAAGSVSPHGLELSGFTVDKLEGTGPVPITGPIPVNSEIQVRFILCNVTQHVITISPEYGIFVGARWNSTTDANNRDFGHAWKGKQLSPGSPGDPGAGRCVKFIATKILNAPGTWRFWPAYNVNGQWGPFRWNEKVIEVYQ